MIAFDNNVDDKLQSIEMTVLRICQFPQNFSYILRSSPSSGPQSQMLGRSSRNMDILDDRL